MLQPWEEKTGLRGYERCAAWGHAAYRWGIRVVRDIRGLLRWFEPSGEEGGWARCFEPRISRMGTDGWAVNEAVDAQVYPCCP